MKYIVTINDKSYEIEVEKGVAEVLSVKDTPQQVAPAQVTQPQPAPVVQAPPVSVEVKAPQVATEVIASHTSTDGELILCPMPGVIVAVLKSVGDKIKKGETLIILEAMKMENEISATKDGEITKILTCKGSAVNTGDPLIVIS